MLKPRDWWRQQRKEIFYTSGEEVLNSITHAVAAVFAVAALVVLVVLAAVHGDEWHVISFSIYGASLALVFLASAVFHAVRHPRIRPVLRRLDHAAIYILIAGTYTPFALISLRTAFGLTLLGVVWALALAGIIYKIFFLDRFVVLTTIAYMAMGWLGLVAFRPLLQEVPLYVVGLLLGGGLVFTLGVIFYARSHSGPYNHAIWHLFVIGGCAFHLVAVVALLGVG